MKVNIQRKEKRYGNNYCKLRNLYWNDTGFQKLGQVYVAVTPPIFLGVKHPNLLFDIYIIYAIIIM